MCFELPEVEVEQVLVNVFSKKTINWVSYKNASQIVAN